MENIESCQSKYQDLHDKFIDLYPTPVELSKSTWQDKSHDKMTSAYLKSSGYKKFCVHTKTKKFRFQIVPLWRAFSKSSVFVDFFMRIQAL